MGHGRKKNENCTWMQSTYILTARKHAVLLEWYIMRGKQVSEKRDTNAGSIWRWGEHIPGMDGRCLGYHPPVLGVPGSCQAVGKRRGAIGYTFIS